MNDRYQILICGAGIAGISTAYYLSAYGIKDILLVDERPPMSLTSDQSTECYRNWWPGPGKAMIQLMNRSIDLMETLADESGNTFQLNRRGYLYCTSQQDAIDPLLAEAEQISQLGAGPLRVYHDEPSDLIYQPAPSKGYKDQPTGADLIFDTSIIQEHFPFLSKDIVAALHARRAGWFSAQQMSMYMLNRARQQGVKLVMDRVTGVDVKNNKVVAVRLDQAGRVETPRFVNAAGPFLDHVARMLGLDLPIYHELHLKAAFNDHLGVLNRAAPLTIFNDRQALDWQLEDKQFLEQDDQLSWLLDEMPAGSHIRPEGGPGSQMILVLWEYDTKIIQPVWPLPIDPQYAEIALRGLVKLIPEMSAYLERLPRPQVDGGYYTKTRENRPLIGKLAVEGAYIIGALSGFGLMAACGAGDLLAAHIINAKLPPYAAAFTLERYNDPEYQQLLENWGDSGQL